MKTLDQLQTELAQAIQDGERYARPAHAVRNCPSDLQNSDQAWRRRQSLEYQIRQLENNEKIY
jgi:ubiquinone biosynthesis protein UbiJ